jgi:hypothetical protein
MSRVDAAKVEQAKDSLGDIRIVLDGLTDKLTVSMAPAIDSLATKILSVFERLDKSLNKIGLKSEGLIASIAFGWLAHLDKLDRAAERSPFLRGAMGFMGLDVAKQPEIKPGTPGFGELRGDGTPTRPRAFERGSKEAVSAILQAGGDPISGLHKSMQEAVRLLQRIEENGDPIKAEVRGRAPKLLEGKI